MADADPKIEKTAAQPVTVEPAAPATPVQESAEPKAKRSWLRPLLLFGVPLVILGVVGFFWLTSGRYASTDNAYVQQDKVSVSAEVAGRIVKVAVRENQRVRKGDLLFEIDPAPYRIAVEQADAAIANAQVEIQTLRTSYVGTGADIQAARDRIAQAQEDYARQAELMKRGFTTRVNFQAAQHAVEQARAALQSAQADAAEARSKLATGAAVPGENPQIAAARVQREQALLNLSRTRIYAPADGIVSQADRLQVGQQMMTGLPAVTIVTSDLSWVEANFKETDLNKMRVGQCAEVSFDAYPGLKLKGHVWSIGAGTGSEFSVLPAQNANGNWVKVTQRVPVRIAIDEKSPRALIAGLSSDVEVDLRTQCK
ncbi:HlyD family secretion protein [Sphingomonas psychrotolerans]|uniref:HlyD family secretion protein n=1 Tax=Sphingomonas psychrotolerans TaxID=1327635 RepID=A0ABU3N233_9SPHN|nr:HlyD family secretion protein [Sphingomonas psychrotolerans]MDT8758331.1 HlyD family secretion protein [Sphingomonas psychrotolerans]